MINSDLIENFRELQEKAGIIKNFRVLQNGDLVFEFAIPEADVMGSIENYLFETYGLVLNCSKPQM